MSAIYLLKILFSKPVAEVRMGGDNTLSVYKIWDSRSSVTVKYPAITSDKVSKNVNDGSMYDGQCVIGLPQWFMDVNKENGMKWKENEIVGLQYLPQKGPNWVPYQWGSPEAKEAAKERAAERRKVKTKDIYSYLITTYTKLLI